MAKEYISRDEMVEQVKARIVLGAPRFNTGLDAAIEIATSIPAADVVEVRHGRWLPSDIPDSILDKCSECGFNTGSSTFNYCPNCGAVMDGGRDDD